MADETPTLSPEWPKRSQATFPNSKGAWRGCRLEGPGPVMRQGRGGVIGGGALYPAQGEEQADGEEVVSAWTELKDDERALRSQQNQRSGEPWGEDLKGGQKQGAWGPEEGHDVPAGTWRSPDSSQPQT